MFQTKFVDKIETNYASVTFFFFENRAIYELMWKDIVRTQRPQITIWHMNFACWIPKATKAHTQNM